MRVLLLGANGMLGSEVYKTLKDKHEVLPTTRKEFDAELACGNFSYFQDFVKRSGPVDWVINAIGVTIPRSMKNPAVTFFVNSTLPHMLARVYGGRLIHITSDCVYSGVDGGAPYTEDSAFSPKDIYGLSKSFGEPKNCITLRTSIIGLNGDGTDLLGWFLRQLDPIKGYEDHLWSGVTTRQFALICDRIMGAWVAPPPGIYHVFSEPISKYRMLLTLRDKFATPVEIIPVSGNPVDRRLATRKGLNRSLEIPTFQQMVEEM
jgi:dTDP-4-dehydrorhamnose reductase